MKDGMLRMTQRILLALCLIVSAVALGCAAYFLVTSRVPLVIAFVPAGRITIEEQPWLYWSFVSSHILLGILALIAAGLISRRLSR